MNSINHFSNFFTLNFPHFFNITIIFLELTYQFYTNKCSPNVFPKYVSAISEGNSNFRSLCEEQQPFREASLPSNISPGTRTVTIFPTFCRYWHHRWRLFRTTQSRPVGTYRQLRERIDRPPERDTCSRAGQLSEMHRSWSDLGHGSAIVSLAWNHFPDYEQVQPYPVTVSLTLTPKYAR